MPKIEMHIRESLERTGKEYKALHEWIDNSPTKPECHDIVRIYKHAS